jgi:hypothetical protein
MNESEVLRAFYIEKNVNIKNHIPVPYVFIATQTEGGNSGKTIFSKHFFYNETFFYHHAFKRGI